MSVWTVNCGAVSCSLHSLSSWWRNASWRDAQLCPERIPAFWPVGGRHSSPCPYLTGEGRAHARGMRKEPVSRRHDPISQADVAWRSSPQAGSCCNGSGFTVASCKPAPSDLHAPHARQAPFSLWSRSAPSWRSSHPLDCGQPPCLREVGAWGCPTWKDAHHFCPQCGSQNESCDPSKHKGVEVPPHCPRATGWRGLACGVKSTECCIARV